MVNQTGAIAIIVRSCESVPTTQSEQDADDDNVNVNDDQPQERDTVCKQSRGQPQLNAVAKGG